MAETSGLKTLKQVVEELLFLSERPRDDYFRLLQLVIRGFRDARLFHLKGFTRVAKLTVSDINTIDLPDDYIRMIGVVVPVSGQYWFLTEKEALVFSQSGGVLDEDDGEGVEIEDGYSLTYGQRGGINREGYYKVDEINNRIIVNSLSGGRTEVMLIYVSSGINEAGTDTYVPDRVVPMLHSYVLYKDALVKGRPYQHFQDDYYRELDKVRYIENADIMTIRDTIYETSIPTAKR